MFYLSSSTAAHSTVTVNDTSSCIFQKNKLIRKYFGNSLIEKHKIFKKEFKSDKEFVQCIVGHDGYQERFKILHERQITLFKNKSHIEGIDNLNCKNLENKNLTALEYHNKEWKLFRYNEEDFKLENHDEEDELSTLNSSEIFNKMLVGFMENNGKTEIKFKR